MKFRKSRIIKSRPYITVEIMSAVSYVIHQIQKGWTAEEACHQMENAYGALIGRCTKYYLARSLNKQYARH